MNISQGGDGCIANTNISISQIDIGDQVKHNQWCDEVI